jgi:hypothetical protein
MNAKLEKIARMAGKTTYKDFRDGFSATSLKGDSDADIKGALGLAQREVGSLAVMVLETACASTLLHERAIRRAWDRRLRELAVQAKEPRSHHLVAVQRMGAALAIRKLAGARMIQHELADYAWLVHSRREYLEESMKACGAWLTELGGEAECAFLKAMEVIKPRRIRRQVRQGAAA